MQDDEIEEKENYLDLEYPSRWQVTLPTAADSKELKFEKPCLNQCTVLGCMSLVPSGPGAAAAGNGADAVVTGGISMSSAGTTSSLIYGRNLFSSVAENVKSESPVGASGGGGAACAFSAGTLFAQSWLLTPMHEGMIALQLLSATRYRGAAHIIIVLPQRYSAELFR